MNGIDTLREAFTNALAGELCSQEQLCLARALAHSRNKNERIWANGVILCAGPANQREEALGALEQGLREGNLKVGERFDMMAILLQARRQIAFKPALKEFIVQMASAPEPELRCNATIVLSELAELDPGAVRVLGELAGDSNASVRHNAAALLKRLSGK